MRRLVCEQLEDRVLLSAAPSEGSYEWYQYNGHSYTVTNHYGTWEECEAEAQSLGGHLATVNDAAENSWLTERFKGYYRAGYEGVSSASYVWIGLRGIPNSLVWANGEPVNYVGPMYWGWGGGWCPPPSGTEFGYLHTATHFQPGSWANAGNNVRGVVELDGSGPQQGILVAAMGDSYSSGEGNPRVHANDTDDGRALWMLGREDTEETKWNNLVHRSPYAASKLLYDKLDPAGTGDFVFASESGATIDNSIVNAKYYGMNYESGYDKNNPLPTQLKQMKEQMSVRGRENDQIDVLTISFGGNDIGFARIVKILLIADELYFPITHSMILNALATAATTGKSSDWRTVVDLLANTHIINLPQPIDDVLRAIVFDPDQDTSELAGLNGLPAQFQKLQDRIAALAPAPPKEVYITEYAAPFLKRDQYGNEQFVEIGSDLSRTLEVSRKEAKWVKENVINPLNQRVQAAALQHGWHYVGGIAEDFIGHYYGALEGWVVTSSDSKERMGTDQFSVARGIVHPNEAGHAAISNRLHAAVQGPSFSQSWDFSSGRPDKNLGQPWEYRSTGNGRIRTINSRLRMDMGLDSGGLRRSLNEAVLRVDLSGIDSPTLTLDHFKTLGETADILLGESFTGHVNKDLIALSVDGQHWVKVTDLTDSFTDKAFPLNAVLEKADAAAGMCDRSNVRIKFQQYGRALGSILGGRELDNIRVTGGFLGTETPLPQSIPHSQDFSAARPSNSQGWEFVSTAQGRINTVGGKLRMDDSVRDGQASLNEAILHVNLAGRSGVRLTLDHTNNSDENHPYFARRFDHHVNADLIAVSLNGVNWIKVANLTGSFAKRTYSLDSLLQEAETAAGTADRSDVRIKFQQYDNAPWTGVLDRDGRAFDNIRVTASNAGRLATGQQGSLYDLLALEQATARTRAARSESPASRAADAVLLSMLEG